MRALYVAVAVVLLTGCATGGPVQCGGCAGPGYVLSGTSGITGQRSVTECVAGLPCATHEERGPVGRLGQVRLAQLRGVSWEDVDGAELTVTVTTRDGVWHGHGSLTYRPGGDGPCDCSALFAEVPLTRSAGVGQPTSGSAVSRPG